MLFGSVGIAFELIIRKSDRFAYHCGAALAVMTALLTIRVNTVDGMIGSEDNPYNLIFIGVLFVALIGVVLARFKTHRHDARDGGHSSSTGCGRRCKPFYRYTGCNLQHRACRSLVAGCGIFPERCVTQVFTKPSPVSTVR